MAHEENAPKPIKVKYVQRVLKDGVQHLYFRKGDWREGPLKSADGTPELKAEVDTILKKLAAATEAASKPKPNTIAGALKVYNRSADFLSNGRRTQKDYQYYIDELTADIGHVVLQRVTRSFIVELRDLWAPGGYRAANLRMQVLKNALKPIILDEADDRIKGDPFKEVEPVRRPQSLGVANLIWTDAEVTTVIEDAIARGTPGLARAVALGRYAGFRKGTICDVPLFARIKDHDRHGELVRRLYWITEKRIVLADMKEDPKLTAILDRTPNRAGTIAYNADGNAWKERQLSQAVDRNLLRLAKKGLVRSGLDDEGNIMCPLTMHGLRHSRGVELARAGTSDAGIQAQLAQSSTAAAAKYRKQAGMRDMADDAQERVDNVREIRAKKARTARE